jgi:hypothetical protein
MDTDEIKRKVTVDLTFLRESPTFENLGLLLFGSVAKRQTLTEQKARVLFAPRHPGVKRSEEKRREAKELK